MFQIRSVALLAVSLIACVEVPAKEPPLDAGIDGGLILTTSPCPAALPSPGTPCPNPPGIGLLACEYGGDAWGNCTTIAACTIGATVVSDAGVWFVFPGPDAGCDVQASGCPDSYTAAADAGVTCAPCTSSVCEYGGEGECGCGLGRWSCLPWSVAGPGCPAQRPKLGATCTQEGLTCNYTPGCFSGCGLGVSLGPSMICQEGLWLLPSVVLCSCPSDSCE